MAEKKRRDSNGILLTKGERQLNNGLYRYRYTDSQGEQHDVYSWTLRPQDKVPEGRKPGISLREQEEQIRKDIDKGIRVWQAGITLNQVIEEYFGAQRPYWSDCTRNNYFCAYKNHIKSTKLGKRKISKLTQDDIVDFYSSLVHDKKDPLSIASISQIDKIIGPALKKAVAKRLILSNPADGAYGELKKKNHNKPSQRHALDQEQLDKLLEFIAEDSPQYFPLFYFLSWTGCRIGEAAALTWLDVDFENEIIHIRRNMQYQPDENGKCKHKLKAPKTSAGCRDIPMLAEIKDLLKEMRSAQKVVPLKTLDEISVDNKELFVFRSSCGGLLMTNTVNSGLSRIVRRYNQQHTEEEALPNISCHIFRHCFCCWLCENMQGQNTMDDVKTIQQIMGHANAQVTMDIYSETRKTNQAAKHEALKKVSQDR
ncbi:MAG: site-specific integrase [Clostridiales bacterium]|nr:site-specific integrase [Clostridiales bacterium]